MRASDEKRLRNALDTCRVILDEILDLVVYAKHLTRNAPLKVHESQFEGLRQRAVVETEYFAQRLAGKLQYLDPMQEQSNINLMELQTKLTAWRFLLAGANNIFQAMCTSSPWFAWAGLTALDTNWRALKCTIELETTLVQLPQVRRRSLTRRMEQHQPWLDWQYDYNAVRKKIAQQQQRAMLAVGVSLLCIGSVAGKAILVGVHYLTGSAMSALWNLENLVMATTASCFIGLLLVLIISAQGSFSRHEEFRLPQPDIRPNIYLNIPTGEEVMSPGDIDADNHAAQGQSFRPTHSLYSLRSIDSDVRHTVATKSHASSSDGTMSDDDCTIDADLAHLARFSHEPPSEMTDDIVRVHTPSPRRSNPRGSCRIRFGAVPTVQEQRAAVETLFYHCGGSKWRRSTNWGDPTASLSSWHGVQADMSDNVTALYLYKNGLQGSFPTELLNRLPLLRECCLWGNELTGHIGDISSLQYLRVLSLGGVNGGLPLTPAPLHDSLSTLLNLKELSMARCNLSGSLPDWLCELDQLQKLVLYGNNLEGPLPAKLVNSLVWLTCLDLSDNKLTGEVPHTISRLGRLQELRLSGNNLCGALPEHITKLTALEHLYLSDNQFTGFAPPGIAEFACLRELSIENTQIGGLKELSALVTANIPNCVIYT